MRAARLTESTRQRTHGVSAHEHLLRAVTRETARSKKGAPSFESAPLLFRKVLSGCRFRRTRRRTRPSFRQFRHRHFLPIRRRNRLCFHPGRRPIRPSFPLIRQSFRRCLPRRCPHPRHSFRYRRNLQYYWRFPDSRSSRRSRLHHRIQPDLFLLPLRYPPMVLFSRNI